MEMHWLRYFVAAAEAGSVSRAAERVHVAQPSLSAQIRKLERHLGVALFDRTPGGVVLTEAGRAFYPRARRILGEVREAVAALGADVDAGRGRLSVGAIPTMAPYLLPPALDALRRAHPDGELVVREDFTERLVEALVDHELDCALVSAPLVHPLLVVEPLGVDELLVAVPPDAPGPATPDGFTLGDLADRPAVTLEEMHCLGRQVSGLCVSAGVAPRVVCRTAQLATVRELVALGVGLSIVPEMAAAADLARGGRTSSGGAESGSGACCRYVRFAPDASGARPSRAVAVAWRRDRTRGRLAERFVAAVAAQLAAGRHRLP